MSSDRGASRRNRSRALLAVGILIMVTLLVVLVVWLVNRDGSDGAGSPATATATTTGESGASTAAPTVSVDPSETLAPGPSGSSGPPATSTPTTSQLPPVEPDETATSAGGLEMQLVSTEAVTGEAVQPGDVGGPALRMTVSISNPGDEEVSLSGLVANCYYGEDEAPAGTLTSPGGVPMPATVDAGSAVTAVYLFTVPPDERSSVRVTLDLAAGEPLVVFEGDLS